jgi:Domain of unknown function (DUF4157)
MTAVAADTGSVHARLPSSLVPLGDATYGRDMAVSAAFARASEPADAVTAAQSHQARRQAPGRAGAPHVPPSRVPVRLGAADPGLRASQRTLRECDCAENPATPSCEQRQVQSSGDGLRPSRIPAGGPIHPSITSAIEASRGGGGPLERTARERLELGLGESLGDVRVHADAHAGALARAVSARAFTVGSDLFFAAGAYRPGSRDGDELIAHEVTHAVQQRGAPGSGPLSMSAPGDAAELEAEAVASRLQAEASAYRQGESSSTAGHGPARTAGTFRATRGAAISIARTVDPESDAYQRGLNDGRAGNPAAPGPIPADAYDDYNEGYQVGQDQAAAAQASLPPTTSAPGSVATPAPATAPAKGTLQVPEVTIVGNPTAYKTGFNDGHGGVPSDPIGRVGFANAQDYLDGYQDGQSQAQGEALPPYSGPSIGPAEGEEEEPGEGPEKPDEPGEYKGAELGVYTYLRGLISQWRELRGWDPSEPCPLSHADLENYRELYSKYGGSDPSAELPPTEAELEGPEVGEEEEEAE